MRKPHNRAERVDLITWRRGKRKQTQEQKKVIASRTVCHSELLKGQAEVMGTPQGLGSPHMPGDAENLMSSHSRYGQNNIKQSCLKEPGKTGWWERRRTRQQVEGGNRAELVPSEGKLIHSGKGLKKKLSCPGQHFNRNLGAFVSEVYSLWRIPCFSSWIQASQHTGAAPPSNWEKLDGPVPFSMISLPTLQRK